MRVNNGDDMTKSKTTLLDVHSVDLFAGNPVADYAVALEWYKRLLGSPPTFFPNDIEAVWELAEHRHVYIVQRPEHGGHAMHTIFGDDLATLVPEIPDTRR